MQSCPSCSRGPTFERDEERHERRASQLYAQSRELFNEANEEHRMAGDTGGQHHHVDGCTRATHIAEAADLDREARDLSDQGDAEAALAKLAREAADRRRALFRCPLCGGAGTISGNGSAQIDGTGRTSQNNVGR